jgi:hypothetical protein
MGAGLLREGQAGGGRSLEIILKSPESGIPLAGNRGQTGLIYCRDGPG